MINFRRWITLPQRPDSRSGRHPRPRPPCDTDILSVVGNGSVEIVGFDLLYIIKWIISEFRWAVDEWDVVIPAVNYIINHRMREVLGDRSVIEVMTGRASDTTALKLTV